MKESVVADSTCLIALERINQLDLLPALYEPILIPSAVAQEFGNPLPWLTVEIPVDDALVSALKLLVDDGEAEAIALACERKVRIILDDRQARAVGRRMNLSIIGTIGILVHAKQTGLRPALRPLIEKLEQHEFYLSDGLKAEALRLVGEHEWRAHEK